MGERRNAVLGVTEYAGRKVIRPGGIGFLGTRGDVSEHRLVVAHGLSSSQRAIEMAKGTNPLDRIT